MGGTFYFRKNSTTYKLYSVTNLEFASSGTVENFTATSNFLKFYRNTGSSSTAICYVPALTTQGSKVYAGLDSDGSQVYYDTSSPTIAFRKGGKTYYCAKSVTKESYTIPAGTYTITAFQTIIKNLYGISSWGTGVNGSYIEKTWSNTNLRQNNKLPNNTAGTRKVRLCRWGNGNPYFSYDWLTGAYWYYNGNLQWCTVASLTDTKLAGIVMFAGDQCAYPIRPNGSTAWLNSYPVTVIDGINVT